MEDYFYFTICHEESGEVEFLGYAANPVWDDWREAMDWIISTLKNAPSQDKWVIEEDHLFAPYEHGKTIQLNSTGYEKHLLEWINN